MSDPSTAGPLGTLDAPTQIHQAPPTDAELGDTLRSTLPPAGELDRTLVAGKDLSASRRSSLMATLGGAVGPLPDRYEEGRVLGKGGMGVVVLAHDRDLARPVAVKKLPESARGNGELDRFLREAQVTAQLEHPGILPVDDVGVDERGSFFYVMRLVGGDRTVRRVIDGLKAGDPRTHAEYTFERRVKLVQQVAQILHYAHTRGVVHRDVKPENIMLGAYGEVYLVDWGLAKVTGNAALADPMPASHAPGPVPVPAGSPDATQAGAILGTPRYMSPEQANGEPATPLSDVYSLTAVLYELLSLHHYLGKTPATLEQVLHRILSGQHAAAESYYDKLNGRVPRHLSFICERGLAKNPADRFPSASELEKELERWLEGWGPCVCPVTVELRLLTIVRHTLERYPRIMGFVTAVGPGLALLAYGGYRLVRALQGA